MKNHELGEAFALGLISHVESQVIGQVILALLHYHALHTDIIAIFVVKCIGKRIGTKLQDIGLNKFKHAVVLGAEDNTLEVGLLPIIFAAISCEVLLQTNGVPASSLPDTAVADLEQQHAITVLVKQVAVLWISVNQLHCIIINQ